MVADNVMVALLGIKLDGKATDIANSVGATLFTTSSAQTEENGGFLAHAIQKVSRCDMGDVICDFELSQSTRSFGMNNPIG